MQTKPNQMKSNKQETKITILRETLKWYTWTISESTVRESSKSIYDIISILKHIEYDMTYLNSLAIHSNDFSIDQTSKSKEIHCQTFQNSTAEITSSLKKVKAN